MKNRRILVGIIRIYISCFIMIKFLFRGISAVMVDINGGLEIGEAILIFSFIILILTFCIYEFWMGINEIRNNYKFNIPLQILAVVLSSILVIIGTFRLITSFEQTGTLDLLFTVVLVSGLLIILSNDIIKLKRKKRATY